MCKFKSAIVVRDEREKGGFRLLMSPWTESHSELITLHELLDDERLRFARVEFSPESMDKAYLPETYRLTIDEERRPDWFDDEMQQKVADRMRAYIKSIIVDGYVALLLGGQFIIAPGARVESARAMVLNAICGGTVEEICGGTVEEICGGTVNEIWGGTVKAIWGGTVEEICGGTVEEIRERFYGFIGKISGDAKVTDKRNSK